ncbi:MAG: Rpn family recombination-promoting nuclease/putative transposase [bacterium]|nr:Rpn family recombination-promoting nuclease/putative transposase [bacterium]
MSKSTLEYTKDSFIDKHLKEYFSDLLFKADLKDGSWGYVYILFEHKSYEEPLSAFHILRYMVKIWEMWLKKNEEKPGFPVIIPLILYHGEGDWQAGLNFRELFDCPDDLVHFIPDFQYLLWDASRYNDEDIKGEVLARPLAATKPILDCRLRIMER